MKPFTRCCSGQRVLICTKRTRGSIFKFDLVAWIFGGQTAVVSRIIYTIVGLAGLWCISLLFRRRPLRAAEDDA